MHMLRTAGSFLVIGMMTVFSWAVAEDAPLSITDMSWLAGEWIGEGKSGDEGAKEGDARLNWTPPAEGSVSATFMWHARSSQHMHYAFTVFQQTDTGVEGKGIHYGKDFITFEDAPWRFEAVTIETGLAKFKCVEHCRANSVVYELKSDGVLEARWDPVDPEQPDWIVTYRRP